MSTSSNSSIVCNKFHPSENLPFNCGVCKCHYQLHYCKQELPPNKIHHHPPTNPPPPMSFHAQTPILQYEKVVLGESGQKIFTPDQKYCLNTFGENLGWTLSGHDDREIDGFCAAIGINRIILKKWFKSHKPKSNPNV